MTTLASWGIFAAAFIGAVWIFCGIHITTCWVARHIAQSCNYCGRLSYTAARTPDHMCRRCDETDAWVERTQPTADEQQMVANWLGRQELCPECCAQLDPHRDELVLDEYGVDELLWRHETCPGGAA